MQTRNLAAVSARILRTRLKLLGSGLALPGPAITTAALLSRIEHRFGIPQRTGVALGRRLGVQTRHHSREWLQPFEAPRAGHRNPELAALALVDALAQAGLPAGRLQFLFGHTTTPARLLPPNISEVAGTLGIGAPYVELRQACAGFANALQLASGLLQEPSAAPVAIVGSETGSVFFDPRALTEEPGQWVNLMQMGDGAGAVVLGPDDGSGGPWLEALFFGQIGLGRPPGFTLEEGGSDYPAVRQGRVCASFHHDFEAVKQDGVDLFQAGLAAAASAGVELGALTAIVPHQANGHIGEWLSRALGIDEALFWGNGDRVGNLGSASIWVALAELRASGRLCAGDRVLFLGAEATQYLYGGFVYVHA
ncbi:MAG: ketoacyl-ACP synthase III [Nevskia sp.]